MSASRTDRPIERFWPYVEKPEEPTAEELAALDPDLHDALFGQRALPFSFTVVFPDFEGPQFDRALELAAASAEYRAVGADAARRHRARSYSSDLLAMRDLYRLVGSQPGMEVLIDDRAVPYSRELWLPLIWLLLLD